MLTWRHLTAPQLFVGSFALLILVGTLGLQALPGLYTGEPLGLVDALFTATSAVCVTGLIVVDTATYFTTAGQAWILLLIQLGGLGMITFATVIIIALGRRLSLRHEALHRGAADLSPHVDYRKLTGDVVRFTLILEAVGAAVLYFAWVPAFGWSGAAFHAIFNAISAFCNAGFSTFSDSLAGFQTQPLTLFVVMILIVIGGIGFLTLEELYLHRRARRELRQFRISLHSRLVLLTTVILLLGGWLVYTALEWRVTLAGMPVWARPFNSLFMSVTARTAGFNTVDHASASAGTNFFTILLMSIGGSPGSTAGGMKTTTLALIALFAWSRFRNRDTTSIWGRSVPVDTVQRAVGLFAVGFIVMTAAIMAYLAVELGPAAQPQATAGFLPYMFEAASAFNTVGLSMGVTGDLGVPGRWLTILLMFVGRVGPLTIAAAMALGRTRRDGRFRFAYEDVVVG
ncbi:MAG TPA: TrkH family potassium uptake protein [Longimicrobiales bacterium]|nr:TrkH family potassium uptake protein [Longimicrobiales bacterium]